MRTLSRFAGFAFVLTITAPAAFSQSFFFWKHSNAKPKPAHVAPVYAVDQLHTEAVFTLHGRVIGTVDDANAVLYDTTNPVHQETVNALESGAQSVENAKRVCTASVPGQGATVGPGGQLYLDYVTRADYAILVCAPVKFTGHDKPVWTSAVVPISREDFTASRADRYDLPSRVEISLDPYVHELNADPTQVAADTATPVVVASAAQ